MFIRSRTALGLAIVVSLIYSVTAFAKGGFDFIAISSPNLKEEVRVTDSALTEKFFTFADFSKDRTEAPADPGEGYEILRYYIDGKREIVFDRLHYYPETGFVFYDGIENGASEYDDKWYTADPEIKSIFESALAVAIGAVAPLEKKEPASSQPQAENPPAQPQAADSSFQSLPILITVLATGLAALFVFAFVRRKTSTQ